MTAATTIRSAGTTATQAVPSMGLDAAEERLRPWRPAPPQVVGELIEALELGGQVEIMTRQGRYVEGGHGRR